MTFSPQTNGSLVRLVGRCRINDKIINWLCAGFLPYLAWSLWRARSCRTAWADVFMQVFSWGRNSCKELVYRVDVDRAVQAASSNSINVSDLATVSTVLRSLDDQSSNSSDMRFVCISDTHNLHRSLGLLPAGDVLVHTGDFTNFGSLEEVLDFADWLADQPHRYKLVVPGNHDMILDREYYEEFWGDWSAVKQDCQRAFDSIANIPGAFVLIDKEVLLDGKVRVFGSPWVPQYASWKTAFNKKSEEIAQVWADRLPSGIRDGGEPLHVLLTHSPARGYQDREITGHLAGCPHLRQAVDETKPLVHVFGHVHSEYGVTLRPHSNEAGPLLSVNAASVSDYYLMGNRCPIVFDIRIKD